MRKHVSPQQIQTARCIDLGSYLLAAYPSSFERDPDTDMLRYHADCPIQTATRTCHLDHAVVEGNPIDFLMRYLDYGFVDAVQTLVKFAKCYSDNGGTGTDCAAALCGENAQASVPSSSAGPAAFQLPPRDVPPFRRLFGFLCHKNISYETAKSLVCQNLVYQESIHSNAVFLAKSMNYYEMMGTISYSQTPFFHFQRREDGAYWSTRNSDECPSRICVCLTALDAVCLMELQKQAGITVPTAYTSVGTVDPENAILEIIRNAERISASTILAIPEREKNKLRRSTVARTYSLSYPDVSWTEDLSSGRRFYDPVYAPR